VLVPFWALQILFMSIMIVILALAVGVLSSSEYNSDYANYFNEDGPGVSDNEIDLASRMFVLLNSPGMI